MSVGFVEASGTQPGRRTGELQQARLVDVAREAGVSLATVDRVVNNRPGASARTVVRVHDAVRRLTQKATQRADERPLTRPMLIGCLLPTSDSALVQRLRTELSLLVPWMADQGATLDLRTTGAAAPAAAAAAVKRMRGQYDAVILMLQDHPLVRDAVDRMCADGTCVVTLASRIPTRHAAHFVGIDSRAAGRTAATMLSRFVGSRQGSVAVVLGRREFQDHTDRLRGFQELMAAEHPHLHLLPPLEAHEPSASVKTDLQELLSRHPGLVGLFSMGADNQAICEALKAGQASGRVAWVCDELTPLTRHALQEGTASAVISQNAAQEARSALQLALSYLNRQISTPSPEAMRIEIYLKENLP